MLTLSNKDGVKIFVLYFYHAESVLGQGEYWKHYFEMVFPKLIINVDSTMLQAHKFKSNQMNTNPLKITPDVSNKVEQVIMVEQTPSRPNPDITTADKSTPTKLHKKSLMSLKEHQ